MNLISLCSLKRFGVGDFECRKKCFIWMIKISLNFAILTAIIKMTATGRIIFEREVSEDMCLYEKQISGFTLLSLTPGLPSYSA